MSSSTGRKEETTARWSKPDRLKFYALIEKKVIDLNDPRHNTPAFIDNIGLKNWTGKNKITFRDNYRTTLATYLTDLANKGQRAPAADSAEDNVNDEDDDDEMPPKKALGAGTPAKSPIKSGGDDVNDLADRLQDTTVSKKAPLYSTEIKVPYHSKTFLEDGVRYIEVDICLGAGAQAGELKNDLTPDGEHITVQIGSFAPFFGTRRLRKLLGANYDGDSSHVIAHRQTCDEFKKAERKNIVGGVVYPSKVQTIKIPRTVTTETVNAMDGTITPVIHQQFLAICTFRMVTVDQLEKEKKAVRPVAQNWNMADEYDSDDN